MSIFRKRTSTKTKGKKINRLTKKSEKLSERSKKAAERGNDLKAARLSDKSERKAGLATGLSTGTYGGNKSVQQTQTSAGTTKQERKDIRQENKAQRKQDRKDRQPLRDARNAEQSTQTASAIDAFRNSGLGSKRRAVANQSPAGATAPQYTPETGAGTVDNGYIYSNQGWVPTNGLNYTQAPPNLNYTPDPSQGPQYTPAGGYGTQDSGYTYTTQGWGPSVGTKQVSGDFTGGSVKKPTLPTQPNAGGVPSPFQPTIAGTDNFGALNNRSSFDQSSAANSFTTGTGDAGVNIDEYLAQKGYENKVFQNLRDQYEADSQLDISSQDVRNEVLRDMRQRISARDAIYQSELARLNREGGQRLGENRAQSARAGLLGSDFGTQQKEAVMGYNADLRGALRAEQDQALGEIFNDAFNFAQTEINNLRVLKQQGGENYLKALEIEQERMDQGLLNTVNAMIARGVDPTTLKVSDVDKIASQFGASGPKLLSFYQQSKQDTATQDGFTLSQGEVRFDANGNLIAYGGDKTSVEGGAGGTGAQVIQNTLEYAQSGINALTQIANNPAINVPATQRVIAARIPGSAAKNLLSSIQTLQALISFDALQDMRNASKTGGALGQVSERELDLLGATVANLRIDQSTEQLNQNLRFVEQMFIKMQQGAAADLANGFGTSGVVGSGDANFDF